MTFVDVIFGIWLTSLIGWLALVVPMSRRVLVAWSTWVALRWRWRKGRAPQSRRRWLWILTLHHANGRLMTRAKWARIFGKDD
jgi:hypothetical protein